MKEEVFVPALSKGLDILEHIIENQGITFNQLKELTGFNVATLSRTLNQLSAKGYIYKNLQKQYYPGYKIINLDIQDSYINQLRSALMPKIKKVSEEHNLTIMLILFSQDHMVVIDKVTSENNLSMMNIGSILKDYLHFFWGQFHLQSLPPTQASSILEKSKDVWQSYKIRPDDELITSYISQASEGFISDYGKILNYATRFAVPVYNSNKTPIGAIAAGTFNDYLTDENLNIIETSLVNLSLQNLVN